MSGAAPKHVDDDGHIDDGIPRVQSPLASSGEADRGLKEARRDSVPGSETCAAPRDSDSDDGALEELDSIDDPDGVLKELMGRLQSVGACLYLRSYTFASWLLHDVCLTIRLKGVCLRR